MAGLASGMKAVNLSMAKPSRPRLSSVLFDQSVRRFGTLAAIPSNVHAIEASLLFATGLNTFVALVGPCGWGKSHLLEAVAHRISDETSVPISIAGASEWIANPGRFDPTAALLLDDVQDAVASTKNRFQFRMALERRVRAGRRTLLAYASPKVTRQVRGNLPYPHDWIVATMGEPEPSERLLIINRMCDVEGLAISTALARLLASRMNGNGRTLLGALNRLRMTSAEWLDVRMTLKACGLLDPFFADNSSWDLKDHILKSVSALGAGFQSIDRQNLALHTMLHEACLAEDDVARCFNIEPREAYQRAAAFRDLCEGSETASLSVRQTVEIVVDGLLRD